MLVHYAGTVTYNVTGFLDKNTDTLFKDLARVMYKASNPIIKVRPKGKGRGVGTAGERGVGGGVERRKMRGWDKREGRGEVHQGMAGFKGLIVYDTVTPWHFLSRFVMPFPLFQACFPEGDENTWMGASKRPPTAGKSFVGSMKAMIELLNTKVRGRQRVLEQSGWLEGFGAVWLA